MNVDRLVEQARELLDKDAVIDMSRLVRFVDECPAVLAGLADAVEQLRTECDEWRATVDMMGAAFLNDLGTDPESYERFKDSVEFWRLRANNLDRFKAAVERDRDEARARVAALEAEIRVHRDVIRARDRNNPPHIHLGTSAQAPNERLWAMLDSVPSTGQETT